MKKRSLVALGLVIALAAMPMTAYATNSKHDSSDDVSYTSSSSTSSSTQASDTTVHVSSTGAKTTGAVSGTDARGTSFGVIVDAVTSTGQPITVNSRGEAVIGSTAIGLAKDASATAGLPSNVVASINAINSGVDLNAASLGLDMTGYAALSGTLAVTVKDNATNVVKSGEPVEVSLFVSNLVDGLNGVSILYYDNLTGRWSLLPVVKIDPVTKTVSFVIQNSGTVCIVHQ